MFTFTAQAHTTGIPHDEGVVISTPEIDALTTALINGASASSSKAATVNARTASPAADLVAVAKQRAVLMKKLAEQSPNDFLRNVVPDTVRAKLPAVVQAEMETLITKKGAVEVLHQDDFENPAKSKIIYALKSGKKTEPLYLAGEAPGLTSGDEITVSGYSAGGPIVAAAKTGVSVTARVRPDSVGWQSTLLIPITSSAVSLQKPLQPVQIQQIVFQGPFRDYFREQSFGRVNFAGTTTDWITIPAADYPQGACSVGGVSINHPAVQSYLKARRIDLLKYGRVVFIVPGRNGGCGQIGKVGTEINGQIYTLSQAWVSMPADAPLGTYNYFENGVRRPTLFPSTTEEHAFAHCRLRATNTPTSTVTCTWKAKEIFNSRKPDIWAPGLSSFSFILAHEMGHNLGLNHANSLVCDGKNYTDNCQHVEYGNQYDVMGSGLTASSYLFQGGHFNAYYKNNLGWLPGANVTKVTQSGAYSLRPIETATGTQLVSITNPEIATRPLFVELRQPIGFDRAMRPTSAGLVINEIMNQNTTRLLNANQIRPIVSPETALLPGTTFRDDSRGISISNLAIKNGTATFQVGVFKPVCRRGSLPIAVSSPQFRDATTTPGGRFDLTWLITNDDDLSCDPFKINSILTVAGLAGLQTTYYPFELIAYPGPQYYVTVVSTVPTSTKPGVYPYTLAMTDSVSGRVRTGTGRVVILASTTTTAARTLPPATTTSTVPTNISSSGVNLPRATTSVATTTKSASTTPATVKPLPPISVGSFTPKKASSTPAVATTLSPKAIPKVPVASSGPLMSATDSVSLLEYLQKTLVLLKQLLK